MRCVCCNNILTSQESVRRFKETNYSNGDFTDMCTPCLNEIVDDHIDTVDGDGDELFDEEGNPKDEG